MSYDTVNTIRKSEWDILRNIMITWSKTDQFFINKLIPLFMIQFMIYDSTDTRV